MRIKADGKEIEVDPSKSLLLSLNEKGYNIPHLCYQEWLEPEARCRLCLVETGGKLVTSCNTYPKEGMEVITDSKRINRARSVNAELLISEHVKACFIENKEHELCRIIEDIGLKKIRFDPTRKYKVDLGASVVRENNKCINCGRCVAVCAKVQATYAIDFAGRGHHEHVTPFSEHDLNDIACIKCGQCIAACPVGAIHEREHLMEVLKVLREDRKSVV